MAGRKVKASSVGGKSRGKPTGKSGRSRLSHFIGLPSVRRFILVVLVLALLFWQWSAVISWVSSIAEGIWGLFGWGLLIIAAAIGTLVWLTWRRKLPSLIHRWNRWLGGIAFILAAWGILALPFFRLGGSFGRSIIDFWAPSYIGILRIVGLVIIGVILVSPGACLRFLKGATAWLGKEFKRQAVPRPTSDGYEPPLHPPTYPPPTPTEKVAPPPAMVPPDTLSNTTHP